jgi:hypothetical protein
MNDDYVWYLVDNGEHKELRKATSPEKAVEASGYKGEVAVYVADYIGRFLAETRRHVTRLSTARDPLRP